MILLAALLAQAAPAPTTPPAPPPTPMTATPEAADARCVALFGYIGANGTPEQQSGARFGLLYFYGKLRGRHPDLAMTAVLTTAAREVGPNGNAEIARCSAELKISGEQLRAAGTAAAPPKPTPTPTPTPTAPRR